MENSGKIIFQQFLLNSVELMKEVREAGVQSEPLLPIYERWKKMKHSLRVYGFSLMCNQSEIAGVPTAVILGVPADCILHLQPKDLFYKLAEKHKLPFASGDWYVGEFETRASKNLISDENYRAFIELKADEQWFNEHHGKWVGFVGGELVAEADNEDSAINHLRINYSGKEGFCTQVLTEEEEDKKAICIG